VTVRLRDILMLYGLGVLVNAGVALLVSSPGYVDAYYYFNGGLALVEGRGLTEPYLWNYAGEFQSLPVPAFGYWQPLPSFLAAAGIWLFGREAPLGSAQAIFVLLSGGLPAAAYAIGLSLGERRHALLAGALAAFSGIYVLYWSLPESFTPYALAGAGALALAGSGRRAWRWWVWLLAGVCAGLGHLARADGLLLAGVVVINVLLPVRVFLPAAEGEQAGPPLRKRLPFALLALAGYLAIMLPWYGRNLAVFGGLQAPGGLSTLWLIEYNDLFAYPPVLAAGRFFGAGWGPLLGAKLRALWLNLLTFVGVHNLIFLTPFTALGLWRRWRDRRVFPAALYGVLLFTAMTFAFTLPGMRGGWLHSGAALVPFVAPLALLGLEDAVKAVALRRTSWRVATAWRVFGAASVVIAAGITASMVLVRVIGLDRPGVAWNSADAVYGEIGAALDALGVDAGAPVMSNNTPGFYYHTRHGGIPLVSGDETMLLRAADAFGVEWLVLDANVPDPLITLYTDGPESPRLELAGAFGDPDAPTVLYAIRSPP
jgi:hypothetical protein